MKLINKNNFIPTVCITYTVISLFKTMFESILNQGFDNNQLNYIRIFAISVMAVLILSIHYYLQKYPIWLVIIGQYLLLILLVMVSLWIEGHFDELHPDAYENMFWSVTIPYIVGAFIYYISFLLEVKKANKIIKNLKSNIRKGEYGND